MVVSIRLFVPPCTCAELAKTYKVDTAATFSEELTSPFIKHLIHIESCVSLRSIQHLLKFICRIVSTTDTVEQFCGFLLFTGTQFAFGKRVDNLRQTYLGIVAFHLSRIIIAIERILCKMPSGIVVAIAQRTAAGCEPSVGSKSLELTYCITDIEFIIHFRCLHPLCIAILIPVFQITEEEHSLAFAVTEITVEFQTYVIRILAEFLYRHTEFVIVKCAIWRIAR